MLAVAANRHSSFGSLNIFSRDQDLQGGYLVQIPTAMNRYQLSSVSPVQPTLVTPVEEGDPLSVPNTPLSPTFTHANLFGTSRLDSTSQSISQNSPPSPTLPKSVKRKRLAKACDACHRSKRRCEGTQPCSNCDFAGKVCTYTDASGRAVAPPRVRGVDGRSLSHHDAWPYPMRTSISGESELATFRPQTPVPTLSDHYPSALDPSLTKELVNLFFAHCHPVSFIFHRSTFLHDLARAQVPECLLWSILAVAAPHSLRVSSRSSPQWQAGEPFATKAANSLFLENQDMLDLPDSLDSLRIKPCLEVAQTLCLLQVHATVMRRSNKAASYLVLASSILDAAGVLSMTQSAFGQTFPSFVRNEATRRTFWYIHLQTFLSSAFTYQPLPNNSENLNNVPLPIEENSFDFPRVETLGDSGSIYQYLPLPVEHRPCASEFANLLRVSVIFACVVNAVAEKTHLLRTWDQVQSQHPKAPSISRFEADLRKWLELLPEHLRLTEDNLQSCISQLDGGSGSAAWAFIYMHALAESTVLALHEFADLGSEMPVKAAMSPREQKALGNLTMILGALGQRGRANLTMAILLVAVAKYCSPQHPQIANWFEEYYRMWGISFEDLTNVAFRVSWFPVAAQLSFGALQLRPVDHTFADSPVELGNPKRRMSSSDTSSTGIAMTSRPRKVLGSPVGVSDPSSALLSTGQVFGPEERDMARSLTGMLGHLNARSAEMNLPFISDKKWVTDGAGSRERLGSLTAPVTTGGIAKAVSSSSLHPRRGFIGESLSEMELSALPTGGYTGRPMVDFGSDGQSIGGSPHASSSRSGSGVDPFLQKFEGDPHNRNMVLAPSMGQEFPFSIGPQPQYRSTPPSTSPYHDNVSDDADMTINADIAWLSGNEDIMQ